MAQSRETNKLYDSIENKLSIQDFVAQSKTLNKNHLYEMLHQSLDPIDVKSLLDQFYDNETNYPKLEVACKEILAKKMSSNHSLANDDNESLYYVLYYILGICQLIQNKFQAAENTFSECFCYVCNNHPKKPFLLAYTYTCLSGKVTEGKLLKAKYVVNLLEKSQEEELEHEDQALISLFNNTLNQLPIIDEKKLSIVQNLYNNWKKLSLEHDKNNSNEQQFQQYCKLLANTSTFNNLSYADRFYFHFSRIYSIFNSVANSNNKNPEWVGEQELKFRDYVIEASTYFPFLNLCNQLISYLKNTFDANERLLKFNLLDKLIKQIADQNSAYSSSYFDQQIKIAIEECKHVYPPRLVVTIPTNDFFHTAKEIAFGKKNKRKQNGVVKSLTKEINFKNTISNSFNELTTNFLKFDMEIEPPQNLHTFQNNCYTLYNKILAIDNLTLNNISDKYRSILTMLTYYIGMTEIALIAQSESQAAKPNKAKSNKKAPPQNYFNNDLNIDLIMSEGLYFCESRKAMQQIKSLIFITRLLIRMKKQQGYVTKLPDVKLPQMPELESYNTLYNSIMADIQSYKKSQQQTQTVKKDHEIEQTLINYKLAILNDDLQEALRVKDLLENYPIQQYQLEQKHDIHFYSTLLYFKLRLSGNINYEENYSILICKHIVETSIYSHEMMETCKNWLNIIADIDKQSLQHLNDFLDDLNETRENYDCLDISTIILRQLNEMVIAREEIAAKEIEDESPIASTASSLSSLPNSHESDISSDSAAPSSSSSALNSLSHSMADLRSMPTSTNSSLSYLPQSTTQSTLNSVSEPDHLSIRISDALEASVDTKQDSFKADAKPSNPALVFSSEIRQEISKEILLSNKENILAAEINIDLPPDDLTITISSVSKNDGATEKNAVKPVLKPASDRSYLFFAGETDETSAVEIPVVSNEEPQPVNMLLLKPDFIKNYISANKMDLLRELSKELKLTDKKLTLTGSSLPKWYLHDIKKIKESYAIGINDFDFKIKVKDLASLMELRSKLLIAPYNLELVAEDLANGYINFRKKTNNPNVATSEFNPINPDLTLDISIQIEKPFISPKKAGQYDFFPLTRAEANLDFTNTNEPVVTLDLNDKNNELMCKACHELACQIDLPNGQHKYTSAAYRWLKNKTKFFMFKFTNAENLEFEIALSDYYKNELKSSNNYTLYLELYAFIKHKQLDKKEAFPLISIIMISLITSMKPNLANDKKIMMVEELIPWINQMQVNQKMFSDDKVVIKQLKSLFESYLNNNNKSTIEKMLRGMKPIELIESTNSNDVTIAAKTRILNDLQSTNNLAANSSSNPNYNDELYQYYREHLLTDNTEIYSDLFELLINKKVDNSPISRGYSRIILNTMIFALISNADAPTYSPEVVSELNSLLNELNQKQYFAADKNKFDLQIKYLIKAYFDGESIAKIKEEMKVLSKSHIVDFRLMGNSAKSDTSTNEKGSTRKFSKN